MTTLNSFPIYYIKTLKNPRTLVYEWFYSTNNFGTQTKISLFPINLGYLNGTVYFSSDLYISQQSHYFDIKNHGITVDGQNNTIYSRNSFDYYGLIGNSQQPTLAGFNNVTVRNIINRISSDSINLMDGGYILRNNFGSQSSNNLIQNCKNYANIQNTNGASIGGIGGVVGNRLTTNFQMKNCINNGAITSYSSGLCGSVRGEFCFVECVNFGSIASSSQGFGFCSGARGNKNIIIGKQLICYKCINYGQVNGDSSAAFIKLSFGSLTNSAGIIVIQDCFNAGDLNANNSAPVIFDGFSFGDGDNNSLLFENCYNFNYLQGNNSAGFLFFHSYSDYDHRLDNTSLNITFKSCHSFSFNSSTPPNNGGLAIITAEEEPIITNVSLNVINSYVIINNSSQINSYILKNLAVDLSSVNLITNVSNSGYDFSYNHRNALLTLVLTI